ncbi:MAG TPA: hypothetical protein VF338_03370, partial [Leptolinea sp.]
MTMPNGLQFSATDLNRLKSFLIGEIGRAFEANPPPPDDRKTAVIVTIHQILEGRKITLPLTLIEQVTHDILDELLGFGVLQALLDDDEISEVMVNSRDKVYVERKG